ncbi:hypothetical protein CXB51_005689 [Gossypium anomalum]|uniref:Uncharacterized protein n=1 Tax=Gossypium anomalum TaxID=47600 RepID=A0A8J6D9J4_9ROSI|nr:hypothetical protein CXB51_005689 [Gossypium anomalum]
MELIGGIFIAVFCLSFFALQTPCTSLQIQLQSSIEQGKRKRVELASPTVQLPRKLRFAEEVALQGNVAQATFDFKHQEAGRCKANQKEEATVRGNRGKKATMEGRRARPFTLFDNGLFQCKKTTSIHNKYFPVAP